MISLDNLFLPDDRNESLITYFRIPFCMGLIEANIMADRLINRTQINDYIIYSPIIETLIGD